MKKQKQADDITLDPQELCFIPLGGSEQFGVNLNLYSYENSLLAIDCGIGFADHRFPGIDLLLPDPAFVEARRDDLAGLIVTHAHEDHIGAVAHLWPRLRCPVYTTEFAAAVLRRKFDEATGCGEAEIHVVAPGDSVDLGPYKLHFVHVAHSIPGAVAVVVETAAGRIVHSGDWNLDPAPVIGAVTDQKTLQDFGKKGVLAYIGDSTNAEVPGRAGSERDVERGLEAVFKDCKGRIAVTMFASNVGRLHSVAKAAESTGRSVCIIGRSLHTMSGAARKLGMIDDIPDFVTEDQLGYLPDENVVLVLTGSQGEARAALARIARGEHSEISLNRGDTVIFSSRAIPGNESEINAVKNNLSAAGVNIITPDDTRHCIHVSGHPCRDEITDMYQWLNPQIVVPVHGERTQLEAQAALARSCQVDNVIVPSNGSVVKLAPGKPEIVAHVPVNLLAVEAARVLAADHPSITQRRKLQYTGAVHVTLVLDERGTPACDPIVTSVGLIDENNDTECKLEDDLIDEIGDILADMQRGDLQDDHAVHEEVRIGVRRFVNLILKIKPKTTVHVVRV